MLHAQIARQSRVQISRLQADGARADYEKVLELEPDCGEARAGLDACAAAEASTRRRAAGGQRRGDDGDGGVEEAEIDPYDLLGVARDAKADAIKHAFRRAALKWHPDKQVGSDEERREAEARFKEVNLAHSILSDPIKRRQYDVGARVSDLAGR